MARARRGVVNAAAGARRRRDRPVLWSMVKNTYAAHRLGGRLNDQSVIT